MAETIKVPEKKKPGRPFGATTQIAKLQRIANRLEQMARTQGMNIIQDSLNGKDVDKETLSTAKWVVTSAKEFHKACLHEKELKNAPKEEFDDDLEGKTSNVTVEEVETEGAVVFQLHMAKE